MKEKIKNTRFEPISSNEKGFKKVQVIFTYKGKEEHYYVYVEEGENVNYLLEAEKQFNQDLQSGKVLKLLNNNSNRLWPIVTIAALGAVAVTFAALFTYKMIESSQNKPIPSNYVTLTLDAGKGNVVEDTNDTIFKYYVRKGTSLTDAFKIINYKAAIKENEDFYRWELKGDPIAGDYVIKSNVYLKANYKPIKDGCITITTREDDIAITFSPNNSLKISTDGINWKEIKSDNDNIVTLEHAGDQIYVKRELETAIASNEAIFSANKAHNISGNLKYIVNGITDIPECALEKCFYGDAYLMSAKNLNLGDMKPSSYCYSRMFSDCSKLVSAPELPSTTLAESCYSNMFENCRALKDGPKELPAKTAFKLCYNAMFLKCSSLLEAPIICAETLEESCYDNMFGDCSSLIKAPDLPVENLSTSCYAGMFTRCSSLVEAPDLPCKNLSINCYSSMFSGCTSLIKTPKMRVEKTASDSCSLMFADCTSLSETQIELPAQELGNSCYLEMFFACTSLIKAPIIGAETFIEERSCDSMFCGCSSLKVNNTEKGTPFFTCYTTEW